MRYFLHAAQGLEERKQVLYLLGPGGRRQVVAGREDQRSCAEYPVYSLKDPDSGPPGRVAGKSAVPFDREKYGQLMEVYVTAIRAAAALTGIGSPWALKRLREYQRRRVKFRVVRVMPSVLNQIGS